jgi:hypothetical protein
MPLKIARLYPEGSSDRTDKALMEPLPFYRNQRGNLTCRRRGLTATVFSRKGGYYYCIARDDDGPSYGEKWYGVEAEAVEACEVAVREVLINGD